MKTLKRFFKEEDGLVAIEYGVIAVGIALAIIITVALVGDALDAMFLRIIDALTPA
jgi:pilus assembly protein Flp/PilA